MTGSKTLLLMVRKAGAVPGAGAFFRGAGVGFYMGGKKPFFFGIKNAAAAMGPSFFCRRAVLLYKVRNGKFV